MVPIPRSIREPDIVKQAKALLQNFIPILEEVRDLSFEERKWSILELSEVLSGFMETVLGHNVFAGNQTSIGIFAGRERLCWMLAKIVVRNLELEVAELGGALRRPVKTYVLDDIVNFRKEAVTEKIDKHAPLLKYVLATLFRPTHSTRKSTRTGKLGRKGPAESESDSESDGDDEEDEEDDDDKEFDENNPKTFASRDKRTDACLPMAISILCYMRSSHSNLLQGQLAYFFTSAGVSKRVLGALNRLGITVSYTTLNKLQRQVALLSKEEFRANVKQFYWGAVFDNVNRMVSHKVHLLNKQDFMSNQTAGYFRFYPHPAALSRPAPTIEEVVDDEPKVEPLNKSDILASASQSLTPDDIIPEDLSYYPRIAAVYCLRYLKKKCPETVRRLIKEEKIPEEMLSIPAIEELPLEEAIVGSLPLIDKNEALVSEVVEIIKAIIQETQIDPRKLIGSLSFFHGDWLTYKNISRALYIRLNETKVEDRFDFVEPVMGLFHLFMNVMGSMVKNFYGGEEGKDIVSLQVFLKMVGNNRVKKSGSMNVRETENFINVLLDAHIEAALLVFSGTSSLKELEKALLRKESPVDIASVIKTVVEKVYDIPGIQDMRYDSDGVEIRFQPTKGTRNRAAEIGKIFAGAEGMKEKYRGLHERDVVHENTWLFMRDAFVIREYGAARKSGDPGRLIKCVEYWCLFFLGSTINKNYQRDTLHLVACVQKLWGPRAKKMWMQTCLVNLSGKPGRWMTDDELNELVVRGIKEFMEASSNAFTSDYLEKVLSRQILIMLRARKSMYDNLKVANYGSSSNKVNAESHVRIFRQKLLEEKVFTFTAGRTTVSDNDQTFCYEARDYIGEGLKELRNGGVLLKYKQGSRSQWTEGNFVNGDQDGDRGDDVVEAGEHEGTDFHF